MLSGGRYVCHLLRWVIYSIPVWLALEQRVIYFVTICVAHRQPVLANERAFRAFKAQSENFSTGPCSPLFDAPTICTFIVFANRCSRAKLGIFRQH